VDVARRIVQPGASTTSKEIAETFTFTIEHGFVVDGRKDFVLKPYDEVFVRKSPAFSPQRNITVQGEVLFEGDYTLTTKNQRLSDVIRMAGGVTEQAYVRGARIERPLNEDEKFRLEHLLKMAQVQGGSGLDASKMGQDTVYYVGIELDKALANPGSDYDVVLREGDRLVVPEYSGTVKINGNVMHPNTVAYMQGKSYKWYINKAGGYGNGAKRSKAYILYQNGLVSKASKGKVEPGCEIIVPNKTRSANQNIAMIASLGTSLATMVTMIATVTNLIKSF
jgi:protein involved in polysaccharide export with SLBB domain